MPNIYPYVSGHAGRYLARTKLIPLLIRRNIPQKIVADELAVSVRHLRRLILRYRKGAHLIDLLPRYPGNRTRRVPETVRHLVLTLKRADHTRSNHHIADLVRIETEYPIVPSTVRSILKSHGLSDPSSIYRRSFRHLEEEITKCGQMIQLDTCEGYWLHRRRVCLIATMDAFSRYLIGWRWVKENSAFANISVLRSVIEKFGLFEMLYTDNMSYFKVIRHNRSIYQRHKSPEAYETEISRMMTDLGILMVTHRPYHAWAKGRLERFFRFVQERFIPEHTARNLEELNNQFARWIGWYNEHHVIRTIGSRPKDRFDPSGWKPVPKTTDLDWIFSYHDTRKVDKYNGFSFEGHHYLLDEKNCRPRGCLTGCTVALGITEDRIRVYWNGKLIQIFGRILTKKH